MALHNFIRKHAFNDLEFTRYDIDEDFIDMDLESVNVEQEEVARVQPRTTSNITEMNVQREQIATLLMTR